MHRNRPTVVVFDFDGVFIDTETLKTRSYYDCLTDRSGAYRVTETWDAYLRCHPVGLGREEVCRWIVTRFELADAASKRAEAIRHAAEQGELDATEQDIFRENLDEYQPLEQWVAWKAVAFDRGVRYEHVKHDAPRIESAAVFLLALLRSGGKAGLVTRTKRDALFRHFRRMEFSVEHFDAVVCEGDLSGSGITKADMYREACRQLAVTPRDAYAVEDTDAGVGSARAANMGCIVAVPTPATRQQDFLNAGADMVVASLSILSDRGIRQLVDHMGST